MSHWAADGSENAEHGKERRELLRLPLRTRFFICCCVFGILVRSGLNTFMHHMDWVEELGMFTVPLPLPSSAERAELESQGSPRHASLKDRLWSSASSVLRFASPLPSAHTAGRLDTERQWLKYATTWLHTRLEFVGRLIGVDERWTMYSPSVGTERKVVRAVLSYADGSTLSVRSLAEPRDFTTFVRPFAQRRLQHDINLSQLNSVRSSWCRFLADTHARHASGSPLQSIALYELRHALPPPGAESEAHWRAEDARPLPAAPSWSWDMAGKTLIEIRRPTESHPSSDDVE